LRTGRRISLTKISDDGSALPPKPRQKRSRLKGEASRMQILDVSARILNTGHFPSVSMRSIAKEAGITLGGLYFHFKSKEELIGALMERGSGIVYDQVQAALRVMPENATSRDLLEAAIHAHLSAALQNSEYALTLRFLHDNTLPSDEWEGYFKLRDQHREMWMRLINDAQNDGTLRQDVPATLIFFFILGAIGWVPDWFDGTRMGPDRVAHFLSYFCFDGIATEQSRHAAPAGPIASRIAGKKG
jgi:AcrR family transcriptional regulator